MHSNNAHCDPDRTAAQQFRRRLGWLARAVGTKAATGPGRELFERRWVPNDSHPTATAGPVSMRIRAWDAIIKEELAAAGRSRDVEIVTLVAKGDLPKDHREMAFLIGTVKYHTGLRPMGGTVLHKFGTSSDFAGWRSRLLATKFYSFSLATTRRNTPALFGAGLIDGVPEESIVALSGRNPQFPEVTGRVSRLNDGKVGRFGWKGHTASLKDFVLTACSVELGLEVPGHHQASDLSTLPRRHDAASTSTQRVTPWSPSSRTSTLFLGAFSYSSWSSGPPAVPCSRPSAKILPRAGYRR